ncbi:prepilin-type N-terminal cleavage/methylation domain-containing protein [Prosthecobacter dejongeii]|uniref:Prepilin-type N-terminal cleavage/methylation domain-containing protein n=1 Tax=Prosthecobacter dejongeii TaxID=48465 RepID=A0A7W7YHH7_9BACT|nr:prepilin-type N-terminal cleavage/methylation domain-containing protein [Prosthecobacter dejongeii]MBB5036117.1 prepilin-type N-terminal cleavage/methylation domain-containing protein [Prosthecobacter dejongeii]
MDTHLHSPRQGGFTLLEILVALSAFVLLMGGIFAIASGTMELGENMTSIQERSVIRQNFISFIRRSFRNLPGEAEIRLSVQARGSSYVPSLNFVNAGTSFTPGTALPPDTSVDLFAEERPGGYLRVGLRMLDERQTQALRAGQSVRYTKNQGVTPLMDNVGRFEWRFYDPASNRWENNWKQNRRPLLAELNLKLDDGFETRAIFWIPPVVPNQVTGGLIPPPFDPNNPNDQNNQNNPPNPDGVNPPAGGVGMQPLPQQ